MMFDRSGPPGVMLLTIGRARPSTYSGIGRNSVIPEVVGLRTPRVLSWKHCW